MLGNTTCAAKDSLTSNGGFCSFSELAHMSRLKLHPPRFSRLCEEQPGDAMDGSSCRSHASLMRALGTMLTDSTLARPGARALAAFLQKVRASWTYSAQQQPYCQSERAVLNLQGSCQYPNSPAARCVAYDHDFRAALSKVDGLGVGGELCLKLASPNALMVTRPIGEHVFQDDICTTGNAGHSSA